MQSAPNTHRITSTSYKVPPKFFLYATVYLLAGGVGGWLGFAFGMRLGGGWMAPLAALNCAVFSSVLADAVVTRLLRLKNRA